MIQFYSPDIDHDPILPESDSQHCIKVLRMREGDEVSVVDGKGWMYTCRIIDAHPKHAMLEVVERKALPLPWKQEITVAVAPTKNMDRMEWLVEKLVEIGINRFIPIRCRYSERKEIKEERLRKIAVSAMKQSLKTVLPEIMPMVPFSELLRLDASQKLIAYCDASIPRRLLADVYLPNRDVIMLIGPEGDFSEEEIQQTLSVGYKPISLGENRLRTETAALYSVSAFHILDDLSSLKN